MKAVFFATVIASCIGPANAQDATGFHKGSLFDQATTMSPFTSRTAMKKGDIVTILISEASSSSFNATTTATKKDSTTVGPNSLPIVDFFKSTLFSAALGTQSTNGNSSVAGTGQTTNDQKFVAQISVIVKDVLPNGNLVLEGDRTLRVNKETQHVKLCGTVRRDDVRSDNTVLSQNVANARIESDGKGIIQERQRKGILTQILDWVM